MSTESEHGYTATAYLPGEAAEEITNLELISSNHYVSTRVRIGKSGVWQKGIGHASEDSCGLAATEVDAINLALEAAGFPQRVETDPEYLDNDARIRDALKEIANSLYPGSELYEATPDLDQAGVGLLDIRHWVMVDGSRVYDA